MTMFDPHASVTAQVWSDELAELVYCTGVAGWLAQLGPWLGFGADVFPPESPVRFADFENKEKGIKITLHYPFWERATSCDPQNWTIHQLDYDAYHAPLPFGLDAPRETPASAKGKLSDDTAAFPHRRTVTHYLGDGRVVAVEFRSTYVGIAAIHMTRLGGAVRLQR